MAIFDLLGMLLTFLEDEQNRRIAMIPFGLLIYYFTRTKAKLINAGIIVTIIHSISTNKPPLILIKSLLLMILSQSQVNYRPHRLDSSTFYFEIKRYVIIIPAILFTHFVYTPNTPFDIKAFALIIIHFLNLNACYFGKVSMGIILSVVDIYLLPRDIYRVIVYSQKLMYENGLQVSESLFKLTVKDITKAEVELKPRCARCGRPVDLGSCVTTCGHYLHRKCLNGVDRCPMCGTKPLFLPKEKYVTAFEDLQREILML
ncbi:hypothetical protein TVAG_090460 [Trichomonas vaginalis G3]|uniref:RING-type domain-containing protein n=1 Tax=Trichomonas vaginalis (strain ATCC PRA-98 / G3) TaxID=412133 RepID=A2FA03_TRIV3|nr:RING/U-box family [Trichomonas vaginalis G3]EAX98270.1 hypothetical protein TVAG_090460 [Trichomonas vaginalis G3]KAI5511196.1 RING/U-box family [Trichomonas vaginalis G3]|eukprot:XP_001311200.1 hypothetical protein [Trichomonas vaginalis G3]